MYYSNTMNTFVTIKSFLTTAEAHIIKGQLESEGIDCYLKNESIVNTHAVFSDAFGQIDLQVKSEDAERAKEIINISE